MIRYVLKVISATSLLSRRLSRFAMKCRALRWKCHGIKRRATSHGSQAARACTFIAVCLEGQAHSDGDEAGLVQCHEHAALQAVIPVGRVACAPACVVVSRLPRCYAVSLVFAQCSQRFSVLPIRVWPVWPPSNWVAAVFLRVGLRHPIAGSFPPAAIDDGHNAFPVFDDPPPPFCQPTLHGSPSFIRQAPHSHGTLPTVPPRRCFRRKLHRLGPLDTPLVPLPHRLPPWVPDVSHHQQQGGQTPLPPSLEVGADMATMFAGFIEAIRSGAIEHGWLPEFEPYDIPWILH